MTKIPLHYITYPVSVANRTGAVPETSNILTVLSEEHVASLLP